MILEDWKNLSKRTRITRICDKCEKVSNISVGVLRKYNNEKYCKECQKKLNGNNKLSEETKQKISKSKIGIKTGARTEEYIEKYLKGKNNPFYGRKHSEESIRKGLETRKNNPNYRKNFEEGMKKRDISGPKNGMYGKPPAKPKRSKLWYNNICFRSSWELKFAKYLDNNNFSWHYESKTFKLDDSSGYTPDFIIDNTIIEIKGFYWNDDKKFQKAKNKYKNYYFILIDENKLKSLGVL